MYANASLAASGAGSPRPAPARRSRRDGMLAALAVAAAAGHAFASPTAGAAQAPEEREPPQIVVEGTGAATVVPDRATLVLQVETRGARPGEAAGWNARAQRTVLAALRAVGVPETRIATASYAVAPDWEYDKNGNRKLAGYLARTELRVELDSLGLVGAVVDTAVAAGATVPSVQFRVSRADEARREALARAVEQARGDAEAMARAAGGRLGALIELRAEPRGDLEMLAVRMATDEAAETPILPGERTITVRVVGRWRFEAR